MFSPGWMPVRFQAAWGPSRSRTVLPWGYGQVWACPAGKSEVAGEKTGGASWERGERQPDAGCVAHHWLSDGRRGRAESSRDVAQTRPRPRGLRLSGLHTRGKWKPHSPQDKVAVHGGTSGGSQPVTLGVPGRWPGCGICSSCHPDCQPCSVSSGCLSVPGRENQPLHGGQQDSARVVARGSGEASFLPASWGSKDPLSF